MIELMFLLFLILMNAFFAASEVAMISLNDTKIRMMADDGHPRAKMLRSLLSEPSKFLSTIQVGITIGGFLASAFAAENFANDLVVLMQSWGLSENVIHEDNLRTISMVLITVILSYFTLVLGELAPKRIAMKHPEKISMVVVRPISWIAVIAAPFVKLLTFSTNFVVKLFGVDPSKHDQKVADEEEIRMMMDASVEKDLIDENEKEMINNIFDLDMKNVEDIMTHRTEMVALPVEASLEEVIELINNEKYTRIPVYEEGIDNIIGTLNSKDLFQFLNQKEAFDQFELRKVLRDAYFIPASKKIRDLIKDMQQQKKHIAIAIDEYGGTAGLVTIEDVLEEIVGNIFDEHDEPEDSPEEIVELAPNVYLIEGSMHLEELKKRLLIQLPLEDFDTLGGFVIGLLGKIPSEDEHYEIGWSPNSESDDDSGDRETPIEQYKFEIIELIGKRVAKVKLTISKESNAEAIDES
jgi:putative hemolysin